MLNDIRIGSGWLESIATHMSWNLHETVREEYRRDTPVPEESRPYPFFFYTERYGTLELLDYVIHSSNCVVCCGGDVDVDSVARAFAPESMKLTMKGALISGVCEHQYRMELDGRIDW